MSIAGKVGYKVGYRIGCAVRRAVLYVPRKLGVVRRPCARVAYYRKRKVHLPYWEKAHVIPEDVKLSKESLGQFGVTALSGGGKMDPRYVKLAEERLGEFGVTALTGDLKKPVQFNLDSEFVGQPDVNKEIIGQRRRWPVSVGVTSPSLFARAMNTLWPVYDRLLGKD